MEHDARNVIMVGDKSALQSIVQARCSRTLLPESICVKRLLGKKGEKERGGKGKEKGKGKRKKGENKSKTTQKRSKGEQQ
jgi:hypothetical protein